MYFGVSDHTLQTSELALSYTSVQHDTVLTHESVAIDGSYSFREDIHFRELSSWPETRWLMFDVVQKRWIDIPALARIDVGSGLLLTRCEDPDADLTTYEGLDTLVEKALDTYILSVNNPHRISTHARRVPPVPSSSQTIATSSSPIASPSHSKSRKRYRRY